MQGVYGRASCPHSCEVFSQDTAQTSVVCLHHVLEATAIEAGSIFGTVWDLHPVHWRPLSKFIRSPTPHPHPNPHPRPTDERGSSPTPTPTPIPKSVFRS